MKKLKIRTILFTVYFIFMLYILFIKNFGKTYPYTYFEYIFKMNNFTPFNNLVSLITAPVMSFAAIKHFFINSVGNILIYIPLGVLLPCINPKFIKLSKFLFCITIIIVIIEFLQLFLMLGICDIDDILLNILGCTLGYFIYKAVSRFKK